MDVVARHGARGRSKERQCCCVHMFPFLFPSLGVETVPRILRYFLDVLLLLSGSSYSHLSVSPLVSRVPDGLEDAQRKRVHQCVGIARQVAFVGDFGVLCGTWFACTRSVRVEQQWR